jgi:hypothetical protein
VFGLSGCGGDGGGGDSLYVAGEISKGDPDATAAARNDIAAGIVVASSASVFSDILDDATLSVSRGGTTVTAALDIHIEVRFVETVTDFIGDAVSGSTLEVEHVSYVTIDTN